VITSLTEKSKAMASCDLGPRRSKMVLNNKVTQKEVSTFNNLGYSLSQEGVKDTDVNIPYFLKMTGLISTIFKALKVQKYTRLKIYNTVALSTLTLERKLDSEGESR
jgi:hypothetical protein